MALEANEGDATDLKPRLQAAEDRAVRAEAALANNREELYRLRFQALAAAELQTISEAFAVHQKEVGGDTAGEKVLRLLDQVKELKAAMEAQAKVVAAADGKIKALQYTLDKVVHPAQTSVTVKPSEVPNPLPVPGEKPHSVRQAVIPPAERARLAEERLEAVLALPEVDEQLRTAGEEPHLTRQQKEKVRDTVYSIGEHRDD